MHEEGITPRFVEEDHPLIDCTAKLDLYKSNIGNKAAISKLLVCMIGVAEGLTQLASLATYYMFKDDLDLSPTQLSASFIPPSIPYIIRPVLAYTTDSIPIFGTRRKHYLIISSLAESIGFILLACCPPTVWGTTLILFVIQFASAFCLTIAEALVVESLLPSEGVCAEDSVSFFVACKALATLSVAYLSGSLLDYYSKTTIFMVTSLPPLLITVCSCFYHENEIRGAPYRTQPIGELITFLRHPVVLYPAIYVLVLMSSPDYFEPYFFYITNKLGYSSTFVGTMKVVSGVATLIGVGLYRFVFKYANLRNILFWSSVISAPLYMSPALLTSGLNMPMGMPNKMFILCGGFLIESVGELQMLPILAYTSKISPVGLEASVFAAMMTVKSLGVLMSKINTVVLCYSMGITSTNFSGLTILIIICGILSALSILLINLVPTEEEMDVFIRKHAILT